MLSFLKSSTVAAVALVASSAAFAQSPAPVPAMGWGGLYIGAVGAYGWGNVGGSFSSPSFITTWAANQFDTNGGLLGLTLGYNMDLHNKWVLGVEGDIAFGSISGTSYLPQHFGSPGFNPNNTAGEFHQSYFGTLRGRVGWTSSAFNHPTLWYLTGGLAFSDGNREISNVTVGNSHASATHTGWTIGGGFETAINSHWSVKAELLYADLGTQPYQSSTSTVVTSVPVTDTLLRVGVNYKF